MASEKEQTIPSWDGSGENVEKVYKRSLLVCPWDSCGKAQVLRNEVGWQASWTSSAVGDELDNHGV